MQAKKLKLFPKKQVLEEYFRNKTTLYFHPRESKTINWFKPVGLAYANLNFGRILTITGQSTGPSQRISDQR